MPDATTSAWTTQLATAVEVIVANGWAPRDRLDAACTLAASAPEPTPTAGRSRASQFLVDQKVLTREQAQDLDLLLRSQANLPGFKLLRKIGSGGMGVVFLAMHLASGRECALKTLNTRLAQEGDFISRFHREAAALKGIKHPNVAEVIESGECDGNCYLAMEYIQGPSAMDLLRDCRALPEAYALRIIKQVAEGLANVFSTSGLIHRDVKPENILILRARRSGTDMFPDDDVAKLIDFGLVKSMRDDDERLTQTGMTIGTPLYMSPEQVRGEALDCRSDIYGLGATLYHLLTGSTPFIGTSPGAIMSAHLTDPVPDPGAKVPSLSQATRQIVMTSMTKDVGARFLNHEALITACAKALQELTGKNDGAPKLLRKPMVLKPPPRRFETPRPGELLAGPAPVAEAGHDPVSSRIIAKHRDLAAAGDGKEGTGVTRSVQRASPSTHATHAITSMPTAASEKPQSSLVEKQLRERPHLAHNQPQQPVATLASEALDAEVREATGQAAKVGWLAWAALAAAVGALAAYLVLR